MKNSHVFIVLVLLTTQSISSFATNVKGIISTNTEWTVSGSPYIVTGNITVNKLITLTIDSGVIVKFDSVAAFTINGTLRAVGTATSPIIFTSNKFVPKAADWQYIYFTGYSIPYNFTTQQGSIMQYCKISYAGGPLGLGGEALQINSGPFIDNCTITNCASGAFYVSTNKPIIISNNQILNNNFQASFESPIYFNAADSTSSFECNLVYGNVNGGGSGQMISVRGAGGLFKNNIIANNLVEQGVLLMDHNTSCIGNSLIYNSTTPGSFLINRGKLISNSIIGNFLGIFNALIINQDSMSSYTHNNIFNNTSNFSGQFYVIKNSVPRTSYTSRSINAQNNWWGATSSGYINSILYGYNADSGLTKLDYVPFLSSPDTSAPITPVTGLVKTGGGGGIQLSWNRNTEADVAGYKVYYGNPTGYSFSNVVDVGNVTSYTFSGINFFDTIAVTAYDHHAAGRTAQCEGHESWFTPATLETGINKVSDTELFLFPNPANDILNVSSLSSGGILTIYNVLGQQMSNAKEMKASAKIDISGFANGIYFLQLLDKNNNAKKVKFIVQH